MINIRKLVAVDMVFNGTRFIISECALGIILPLFLGLITIRPIFLGQALRRFKTFTRFFLWKT